MRRVQVHTFGQAGRSEKGVVKMDKMKELWKYAYAWASFKDVIRFAEKALQIYNPDNDLLIKALTYGIITSYARPFKQNKSIELSDSIVNTRNWECHELLIELRDKVISHQDPVTTNTDFGYFNQVKIHYNGKEDWQFTTVHPRITPRKCEEIIELASDLLAKCDDMIDKLFEAIYSSGKLEHGKYSIVPVNEKGRMQFVLKKMET